MVEKGMWKEGGRDRGGNEGKDEKKEERTQGWKETQS